MMPLVRFASAETRAVNQKQEPDVRLLMTRHEQCLIDLDRMGVDMQVVMPSPVKMQASSCWRSDIQHTDSRVLRTVQSLFN